MTGAAMVESEERREQRGEHLFEGRLSDSVQRLWLRLLSGFSPRALQRVSFAEHPPNRPGARNRSRVRHSESESIRSARQGSSLRGRRPGRERAAESSFR